jgi:hypothetical protein
VIQLAFTDATGDEHFLWSLSQFERVFARRQRYLFILDATKATHIPSASARQAIGKWQDAHYENTRTWGAGGVMLISSALVRGALTAISWVHKTPAQLYYPATRDQGVEWCIRTAEQAGIPVSEAAQRRLRLRA